MEALSDARKENYDMGHVKFVAWPEQKTRERTWTPHIWCGMTIGVWIKFLARRKFKVSLAHVPALLGYMMVGAFIITPLAFIQKLKYSRKIARTEILQPPIFIIGHWRTGTTFLHELLSRDARFAAPTYYDCFLPHHTLVVRRLGRWILGKLLTRKRILDGMTAGTDRPQEEEFALCNLGIPSPYHSFAYPNEGPLFQEYLSLESVDAGAQQEWKQKYKWFLQCLTLHRKKRLVLKSPTNSWRVRILKKMFPGARFIHIIRDPYDVYPSTINLWSKLCKYHGLQRPNFLDLQDQDKEAVKNLEEHIFKTYIDCQEQVDDSKKVLDKKHFVEVRYEDLIREPIAEIQKIYEQLELGGFEHSLAGLKDYLKEVKTYETNHYELSAEKIRQITDRWRPWIEKYGYPLRTPYESCQENSSTQVST